MTTAGIEDSGRPLRRYYAGQRVRFAEEWRDLARSGHLLYNLVHRDLTVRYKRSFLGALWTMLHPLLIVVILVIVFSELFRFALPHYETYLLSALLPWTFFSQTTLASMQAMSWNGPLLKRVRMPKSIFTLSTVLSGLINLALSYLPLLAIMLIRGVPIRPAILFLPVGVFILAVFTFGLCLALSTASVFFVDVREMFGVAITALLYLTPVIYPVNIIPSRYEHIVRLNPMFHMIELVRLPVYEGRLPPLPLIGLTTGLAALSFLAGWTIFRRHSAGFYPYL
jgi:ABC-type polysaccharide/polyol phosphate export permease